MVFKSLFGGGKSDPRPKIIVKAEKKVTNIYAQKDDRRYFMDQLRQEGSVEAAKVLLKRFGVMTSNTTVDHEEKELACHMLVDMGEPAADAIKDYLRTNDSGINWPFRALRDLLSEEELVAFLTEILAKIGPMYVREPERKEQLILTAAEFPDHDPLTDALIQYLDDDNETIRFVAAEALMVHAKDSTKPAFEERFPEETSHRVLCRICDGYIEHDWALENPDACTEFVPEGYKLSGKKIAKR